MEGDTVIPIPKHYLIYRSICTPFYILSCTVYGLLSEALKLSSSWKSGKTKAHIFTAPILNCWTVWVWLDGTKHLGKLEKN